MFHVLCDVCFSLQKTLLLTSCFMIPLFEHRAKLHAEPRCHPEAQSDVRTHGAVLRRDGHRFVASRRQTGSPLGAHRTSWYVTLLCLIRLFNPRHFCRSSETLLFPFLTGKGNQPSPQLIGSLDGNGNLLPGQVYTDKLKSGQISLSRIQPNTFKLQFLRTQVGTESGTCRRRKYGKMTPIFGPNVCFLLFRILTWASLCAPSPLGVSAARGIWWRPQSTKACHWPFDGMTNVRKLLSFSYSQFSCYSSSCTGQIWREGICSVTQSKNKTAFTQIIDWRS